MMLLFLDANVLFTAAHNPRGKAALVIELGQGGLWQIASSRYAIEEARRNMARKYPERVAALAQITDTLMIVADVPDIPCPLGLAAKDQPIYRAAMACRAHRLLTGDIKDFGFIMNRPDLCNGMLVQSVTDFLDHPQEIPVD